MAEPPAEIASSRASATRRARSPSQTSPITTSRSATRRVSWNVRSARSARTPNSTRPAPTSDIATRAVRRRHLRQDARIEEAERRRSRSRASAGRPAGSSSGFTPRRNRGSSNTENARIAAPTGSVAPPVSITAPYWDFGKSTPGVAIPCSARNAAMTANAVPISTVRVSRQRAPITVSATRGGRGAERGHADGVEVDRPPGSRPSSCRTRARRPPARRRRRTRSAAPDRASRASRSARIRLSAAQQQSCRASERRGGGSGSPRSFDRSERAVPDYRYLIVGGGMTADAACRGIRDRDADGSIGLVGEEADPPYSRPPLSKALWQGKDESSVWRGTAEFGVELHLGRRVVSLDLGGPPRDRRPGRELRLRAPAARDRRPAAAPSGRHRRRHRLLPQARATTAACAPLAERGRLVRRDRRRLHRLRARGGAQHGGLRGDACRSRRPGSARGSSRPISPSPSTSSTAATASRCCRASSSRASSAAASGLSVRLESGRTLEADAVVAGLGIEPATELAEAAGLEVSDGIVVDEYGRAGDTGDVFAAGDVARFPAAVLGIDMRVEHEDQANSHGRAVGANMAGAGRALHAPAVLLLRPVRARLRGCRRGRLAPRDGGRVGRSAPKGRRRLPGRRRPAARVPARRHLGEGRCRDRADRRRRAAHAASSSPPCSADAGIRTRPRGRSP